MTKIHKAPIPLRYIHRSLDPTRCSSLTEPAAEAPLQILNVGVIYTFSVNYSAPVFTGPRDWFAVRNGHQWFAHY
jgi:hypothetical protein